MSNKKSLSSTSNLDFEFELYSLQDIEREFCSSRKSGMKCHSSKLLHRIGFW